MTAGAWAPRLEVRQMPCTAIQTDLRWISALLGGSLISLRKDSATECCEQQDFAECAEGTQPVLPS